MKISAAQAYCILDTVGSSILTKSGEISVSYLLELPEAYSLDRSDLEERHNELFRAFQYVRTGFIHKQDVFLRRKFKPEYVIEGEGYIQTAERKYFDGREYLHHFCILSFTLSGLQSLEKAYQANPLAYSEKLAKADRDRLAEFLESVESAVSIIRNIRGTQIRPLNVAEVKQHLFRYVNGFHDDEGLRDIQCSDMIRIGQKKGIFFAVCDERYLPDRMKVYVTDSTLQEANSQLYMSMLERIGVHVPCSHVVNQIWKFAGGSYREELAERVKLFGRYREFDKAIKSRYDGLASYEQESVPNILRIKANRKSFSKQTTVSVATEGGFFYSFNVTYADSLEHTNYFLPDMSSIRPDTIYLNEVSQTHLIAPEKVIYIDYGDTCIQVSKAENTENIVRMIAATGKVEEFPRQTNVSLATEGGKFYTFNVDYRQQPEAFVYEIGEKRPEKKANVILTDNIIPAGERDQVMSRVYNAKRGIFNKGIVRNKIVFSVNNLHIYDNLLLFTFEIENKSKLPYDIDYIRYYIIDKKTAKLTASQEVDQQALFSENYSPRIEGNGRMKYVIAFDKFTIPDEKVFRIEINEKNGGRHVLFDLENSDIVNVEDI